MAKNNEKMNIEFSKEQFFALLKAVYLGNWMANAQRDGSAENPRKEEYEAIEDYIFSHAKRFSLDEYVDDEDAKEGKFFSTRKFEEETDVHELHEEYDEEVFWDELIDRLGERDFHKHFSREEILKMSQEERFEMVYKFINKWEDEINENGVERLSAHACSHADRDVK